VVFACGNSLVCDSMEDARRVAFGGEERRKVWMCGVGVSHEIDVVLVLDVSGILINARRISNIQ